MGQPMILYYSCPSWFGLLDCWAVVSGATDLVGPTSHGPKEGRLCRRRAEESSQTWKASHPICPPAATSLSGKSGRRRGGDATKTAVAPAV